MKVLIPMSRLISFLFSLAYLIIGLVVAGSHHYFEHLDSIKPDRLGSPGDTALAVGAVRRQPSPQMTLMLTDGLGR